MKIKLPDVLQFVEENGIVLESAKSSIPNVAEFIVGEKIKGSWWCHSGSNEIFRITRKVRASKDILVCRFIDGKITFIHRKLWPSLMRIAPQISLERLTAIEEIHTDSGKHQIIEKKYPDWVPEKTKMLSEKISMEDVYKLIGNFLDK